MFQRCTDKARDVVSYALEEASLANQAEVGSCEILLGLLRDRTHAAAHMLTELGLPPAEIEPALRERIRPGAGVRPQPAAAAHLLARYTEGTRLAPGAKRILELAWDGAQELGCTYIGTEHLLIALVSDPRLLPGRILQELGLEPEIVRESAAKWLGADSNPPTVLKAPETVPHE